MSATSESQPRTTPAPHNYNRIELTMISPFAKGGVTEQKWRCKWSLSGVALAGSDVEATGLDLWNPIKKLTSHQTSLLSIVYYAPNSVVADATVLYNQGSQTGDQTAYSTSSGTQQLEVCAIARAPVGKNSLGRSLYLHKYIHDPCGGASNPQVLQGRAQTDAVLFAKWDTGCGPNDLVPVRPSNGVQAGNWALLNPLYTHQFSH